MHYAVEGHTIVEICALFLPMSALCRIIEIGGTFSEIRADCLYLVRKRRTRVLTSIPDTIHVVSSASFKFDTAALPG